MVIYYVHLLHHVLYIYNLPYFFFFDCSISSCDFKANSTLRIDRDFNWLLHLDVISDGNAVVYNRAHNRQRNRRLGETGVNLNDEDVNSTST